MGQHTLCAEGHDKLKSTTLYNKLQIIYTTSIHIPYTHPIYTTNIVSRVSVYSALTLLSKNRMPEAIGFAGVGLLPTMSSISFIISGVSFFATASAFRFSSI